MVIFVSPRTRKAPRIPWKKAPTLVPTSRRREVDLAALREADDLEVLKIITTFLGHQ